METLTKNVESSVDLDVMLSKNVNNDVISNVPNCFPEYYILLFNPILHGLYPAGPTRLGGGGGHKVPAAFFSETVKATAIKLGTLTKTS